MPPVLAAVAVKPFGVAKARLAGVLDARARARLGMAVAARTVAACAATGAVVAVVTDDDAVAAWGRRLGADVVPDSGSGLDEAAAAVLRAAAVRSLSWAVVHADLPLVTANDLAEVFGSLAASGIAIAPSHDGGTNVLAGTAADFSFGYGPGSFHRHLRRAARARVVARPGTAFDLDTAADLDRVLCHPRGRWVAGHLPPSS